MKKIKLLCLPYAGGSAYYLKDLIKGVNEHIEIVPLELPGRGIRFNDELINDCDKLVHELLLQIITLTKDSEYAFFGYSMGARLIYALYSKLKNLKTPKHMFLCAASAPNQYMETFKTDNEALIERLKSLGGTSDEILNDDELLSIIIPVFRADCNVLNTFEFEKYKCLIDCPVTIMNGREDEKCGSEGWQELIKGNYNYIEYDGGHFFILDRNSEICEVINSSLNFQKITSS